MTEQAVLEAYREFLDRMTDEMLDVVEAEFGGGLLGRAVRTGAKSVLGGIRGEMRVQGRIVVEYAAARATGTGDVEQHERRFLETNPVYRRYDGERRNELRQHLLDHLRSVGDDLAPLIASERDDFWAALHEEYSQPEAEAIVERQFSQAETFTEYKDGIFSSQRIADRVITVVDEGERRLRAALYEELDRLYESDQS